MLPRSRMGLGIWVGRPHAGSDKTARFLSHRKVNDPILRTIQERLRNMDSRILVDRMMSPSELDIAQMKFEMRQMYNHLGFEGSLQVLYEFIVSANILAEVILEERNQQ